jgi:phosphoesterase RecJ-like protein
MQELATQLKRHLTESKKIVLIPHQHPDGDAMGSATAFYEYLTLLGKDTVIFCLTPPAEKWGFLKHAEKVTTDPAIFNDPAVDTIIVLDSGDLKYAGVTQFLANHPATIINIDHHATNQYFGHLNIVDAGAASTTNMLYRLFTLHNVTFTPAMATSLLTGFITDTDNFTNAATSAEAMAASGELIRHGGDVKTINELMVRNKSIDSLKLWGKVLSRLQKHDTLDLTYTYITQADMREGNLNEAESEGIANFLNNLGDTKIALILKETVDGKVKGSFRTIRDDVDVAAIAKGLGGGGHRRAAGFTTDGSVDEVLNRVITSATTAGESTTKQSEVIA